jgi:hypothetical protein
MSLVQYNNFNQPNLNGLVDINSDNITTNSISTGEIIINGENIVDDVLDNKRKLTKIDYDDVEDVTEIDSDLLLTGSILLDDVIITKEELKYLDDARSNIQDQLDAEADDISSLTSRVITNENDISSLQQKTTKIAYNSISDTTTTDSNLTVSNEFNVTSELTLKDDPAFAGFTFLLNTNGKYLYFRVKDMAGNLRTFQIQHSQVYTNIPMYFDGNVSINPSRILFIGDGSSAIRYLVNPDVNAGMRYENRINNYYTNFLQRNATGTDITTLRLHHTKIDSLIRHDFAGQTNFNNTVNVNGVTNFNNMINMNDNLYQYQTTFLYKNLVFTTSNVKLLVLGGLEITQQELSYLSGLTDDIQFQFDTLKNKTNKISYDAITDTTIINSKVQIQNILHTPGTNYEIENTTSTGSIRFKLKDVNDIVRTIQIDQFTNISGVNDLNCSKVIMGGTTLRENGSVVSGSITFNGQSTYNSNARFNNGINLVGGSMGQELASGIIQFSFLSSGRNIFKGSDYFGRLSMTSTDAAENRITQTIISGDLTTPNANLLKNTQIRQTTGGVNTNMPILDLFETSTNKKFHILMNSFSGSYNAINEPGSISNVCIGPTQNNAILTYTVWAQQRSGFKFKVNSTNYRTELWGGNSQSIILDNNTGTSMTNVSSIGFTGGKTVDGNFGNIYTASLLTSVSMSDNTETTLSDGLVLPAGTYNISWNITFIIQTSGTNVAFSYGCYSTSTTVFTNNTILTSDYKSYSIPVGNFFSLTGQDYVHFNSSTTIYLRGLVAHNKGANHVIFNNSFSHLKAIKIC